MRTIDHFLSPRFKVLADYPYSGRKVGQIIDGVKLDAHRRHLERYPHLFKKLKWWEEREIKFEKIN